MVWYGEALNTKSGDLMHGLCLTLALRARVERAQISPLPSCCHERYRGNDGMRTQNKSNAASGAAVSLEHSRTENCGYHPRKGRITQNVCRGRNPLFHNGVDEEIGEVKRRRARLILRWGTSLNGRINS